LGTKAPSQSNHLTPNIYLSTSFQTSLRRIQSGFSATNDDTTLQTLYSVTRRRRYYFFTTYVLSFSPAGCIIAYLQHLKHHQQHHHKSLISDASSWQQLFTVSLLKLFKNLSLTLFCPPSFLSLEASKLYALI